MHERAHAKINLLLSVRPGADEHGYHAVDTVMCLLDLYDDVWVRPTNEPGIALLCTPDPLPPDADPSRNLAYKAAELMDACFGQTPCVEIAVQKRIPAQAGLGGGSSDAAAVIRALAKLWNISLDDERVQKVAASLGADVPFFLQEKPAFLTGRGDVLVERFAPFSRPMVLVKPSGGVSTARAYQVLDELSSRPVDPRPMLCALRAGRVDEALDAMANTMEEAARRVQPELDEVYAFFASCCGLVGSRPLLCGSGSCVAARTDSDGAAGVLARDARERGWWSCATRLWGGGDGSNMALR